MAIINISIPDKMYKDAKKYMTAKQFSSFSELIRQKLRDTLYPELTENGFTKEFEDQVLEAMKEPRDEAIEWDGKTPFDKFVLEHPPRYVKDNVQQ